MKYRKLTENGDYAFGRGGADMHADTPEAVGQAVLTRLRLFAGEWFVDLKEGTPYVPGVLGKHTQDTYDPVFRERILDTEGVTGIVSPSTAKPANSPCGPSSARSTGKRRYRRFSNGARHHRRNRAAPARLSHGP